MASDKSTIAIYASPKCCSSPQLKMYKGYFNVAWFVRAYSAILSDYRVITTAETLEAIARADPKESPEFMQNWLVPTAHAVEFKSIGSGFEGQVALAAEVARSADVETPKEERVERVLMFQDPDDILEHLPEAHALIRNCGIADVGLHINAGATFWAETQWQLKATAKKPQLSQRVQVGFGPWRDPLYVEATLHDKLLPSKQTVTFIAHDGDKDKPKENPKAVMQSFVDDYYNEFISGRFPTRYGTKGTCDKIAGRLGKKRANKLNLKRLGHGPAGGDVIIADQIIKRWPLGGGHSVRREGLSHAVLFFINYRHAQPHEADIHVLLRTCLHPARGVHLILNDRTAREWGDVLRKGKL